jgi:DNA-binding GntR family transcriptional regulator
VVVRPDLTLIRGSGLDSAVNPGSLREPHGIFRLCRLVEPPLAALSCRLHPPGKLDQIEAIIPRFCETPISVNDAYRAYREFNFALIAPAACSWDLRILTPLWDEVIQRLRVAIQRLGVVPAELIDCAQVYYKLVAAYRTGDPELVAEMTLQRIDQNEAFVLDTCCRSYSS